ncbi:TetR/AcrR family transcriptional regulator [Streptomyces sp. NPDC101149]|uniref:TetR/AcrR family transcriptional regulator n=1 Tax=Streptomyces sp. NPDC101149 TaxID=3366113 RepID=UPI00381F9782
MQMNDGSRDLRGRTGKGLATRGRILEHAADLIYTRGVHATNNELVRRAAGVSGSQLSHYFANKESLVRAVIDWQAESVLGFHRSERFARFDTLLIEARRTLEPLHDDMCVVYGPDDEETRVTVDGVHLQERGQVGNTTRSVL